MKVKIITDSISDISSEVALSYDIDVLPVYFSLNDKLHTDTVTIDSRGVADWIQSNEKVPKFRGVSSEDYTKAFQKYADQGREIVVITAGSITISNYDSACHASQAITTTNIQVIDSDTIAGGLAALVLKAADMAKAGESANSISIQLERMITKALQDTLVDSVQFLKYTGLCPAVLSIGESLLHMKYRFNLKKSRDFSVSALSSNSEKAVEKYCKQVFKNFSTIEKNRIVLIKSLKGHEYFSYVHQYIMDLNYFSEIVVLESNGYSTTISGFIGVSVGYMLK